MYYAICSAAILIYVGWHGLALGLVSRSEGARAGRSRLRVMLVVLLAFLSVAYVVVVADAWYREVWNAAGAGFSLVATRKTGVGLIGIVAVGMGVAHSFVTGRPKPPSEVDGLRIAAKTERTVERLMTKHGKTGGEERL